MRVGGSELCMSCHKQESGAPRGKVSNIKSFEEHVTEVEKMHKVKLRRQKAGGRCVFCHDPHLVE